MAVHISELFNEEHDKVVIVKAAPSAGVHSFSGS